MSNTAGIFERAVSRLSFLYLGLAILLTLVFSIPPLVAQHNEQQQLQRDLEAPEILILQSIGGNPRVQEVFQQRAQTSAGQFRQDLIIFNAGILIITAVAGYFLARRSLHPLKEVLDRQEAFAGEVAHELRTPLATILMQIEAFQRENKQLPKEYALLLNDVAKEVKDVSKLSRDLLELMAVEHVDEATFRQEVSLTEAVTHAVEQLRPLAEQKRVKLTAEKVAAVTVVGNRLQLVELARILIDNAIKYTKQGGEVTVALRRKARGLAELTVSDTGVGISSEELPKIFSRFYQVNKRSEDGAGLGLAIAKRIVDLHQGTIDVASEPKKGSTFTVFLERS